jgi:hypothetical protein
MLTAWWLLFPVVIGRAQARLEKTPMQAFWLGLVLVTAVAIPVLILLALPVGPAKLIGWTVLAATFALSSIGAAGIAAHLGNRLMVRSNVTALGGFIRGAVVLQLAAFFPVIGWLFIWPGMLIVAFGATGFALLNWLPREKTQITSVTTPPSHANSPISNL